VRVDRLSASPSPGAAPRSVGRSQSSTELSTRVQRAAASSTPKSSTLPASSSAPQSLVVSRAAVITIFTLMSASYSSPRSLWTSPLWPFRCVVHIICGYFS
jgi:hypothetical protein